MFLSFFAEMNFHRYRTNLFQLSIEPRQGNQGFSPSAMASIYSKADFDALLTELGIPPEA